MITSDQLHDYFIEKWSKVAGHKDGKRELKARLRTLATKPLTRDVLSEIKAIQALLS